MDRHKSESDQIQSELRQERDAAQQQLSDFINQTKFEKESLEGRLQHQLNQTLAQLNQREDECEAMQKQVQQSKELNTKLDTQVKDLQSKLQQT